MAPRSSVCRGARFTPQRLRASRPLRMNQTDRTAEFPTWREECLGRRELAEPPSDTPCLEAASLSDSGHNRGVRGNGSGVTSADTNEQAINMATFARVLKEGFNAGNVSALDPLFHTQFVEHQTGSQVPGLEGLKMRIQHLRRAMPDLHLDIVDTITEGDKICFVLDGTGTHLGAFGPLPASGKTLTLSVIDICRFEDGQIIEHWGIPDRMSIVEQIGMTRPPAE